MQKKGCGKKGLPPAVRLCSILAAGEGFQRIILIYPPGFPPVKMPKKQGRSRGLGTYSHIHRPYCYYDIYYFSNNKERL